MEGDEGKTIEAAHVDIVGRQPNAGAEGVVVHKVNVRQLYVLAMLLFDDKHPRIKATV